MAMGFLDRMRGNPQSVSYAKRPAADPARASLVQNELLLSLSRREVDQKFREFWMPLSGPVEPRIQEFMQTGMLQEATPADKLDSRYLVKDLKAALQQHRVKPKGNKPALIQQVLDSFLPQEVASMTSGMTRYRATDAGAAHIESFKEWKKADRLATETQALSFLRARDVRRAAKVVSEYGSRQLLPSSVGDIEVEDARYLISLGYEDLAVSPQQRSEVGARIALAPLFGYTDTWKQVLEVCGGDIPCPALVTFLNDNPCGIAARCDTSKPDILAQLYTHTKLGEAMCATRLRPMLSMRVGKGIEILSVPQDPCLVCDRGKHKYRWSEIEQMPKLPRHWGCRCTHVAWI